MDVKTKYNVTDGNGQARGQLQLSELEAKVMQAVLSKGDLMTAGFTFKPVSKPISPKAPAQKAAPAGYQDDYMNMMLKRLDD